MSRLRDRRIDAPAPVASPGALGRVVDAAPGHNAAAAARVTTASVAATAAEGSGAAVAGLISGLPPYADEAAAAAAGVPLKGVYRRGDVLDVREV
jgi:hypothetical protein